MATLYLEFSAEEINESIPYELICATRYGARWNTMRRKRRWMEEFSEKDRESASRLFAQSRNWFLVKGVPPTVKMTMDTFSLWQRLGVFCASI